MRRRDYSRLTEDVLIPLLRGCIQNRCVNDGRPESGGEARSVALLADFFRARGLESEILRVEGGEAGGRENLLVRLPGRDPQAPSLLYLGHLDVVPASPEGWDVPPFEGKMVSASAETQAPGDSPSLDGGDLLYGRGTVDMLNMTCAMAVALGGLAEEVGRDEQRRPRGDLLFLASADEENASRFGVRSLAEEDWETIKADYVITELGGYFAEIPSAQGSGGTTPALAVTVGEKGVAWVRLTFRGKPSHGSLPLLTDNAVTKLCRGICRLSETWDQCLTPPEESPSLYRQMVEGLAFSPGFKARLLDPRQRDALLKELAATHPGEARFLHAASRTTLSVGPVQGGEKTNVVPARASAELDIRLLPGETLKTLEKRLRRCLGDLGDEAEIDFFDFCPPAVSPWEGPLSSAVESVLEDQHPGIPRVPFLIGGVTDARFFRARGVTAYGVTGFSRRMTLKAFSERLHGRNERIDRESLEKGLEFFYELPGRL